MTNRLILAGYIASRGGSPATVNPWPVDTYGALQWSLGWTVGSLPPVPRALLALVLGLL